MRLPSPAGQLRLPSSCPPRRPSRPGSTPSRQRVATPRQRLGAPLSRCFSQFSSHSIGHMLNLVAQTHAAKRQPGRAATLAEEPSRHAAV